MDDTRFDAWTRRKFGYVVSGGFAFLIESSPFAATAVQARQVTAQAKKKKKKTPRCLNVRQSCNPDAEKNRERCCARLRCGEQSDRDGHRCCRSIRASCRNAGECCNDLLCDTTIQSGGKRCCVDVGNFCQRDQDCCRGGRCDNFRRVCV